MGACHLNLATTASACPNVEFVQTPTFGGFCSLLDRSQLVVRRDASCRMILRFRFARQFFLGIDGNRSDRSSGRTCNTKVRMGFMFLEFAETYWLVSDRSEYYVSSLASAPHAIRINASATHCPGAPVRAPSPDAVVQDAALPPSRRAVLCDPASGYALPKARRANFAGSRASDVALELVAAVGAGAI